MTTPADLARIANDAWAIHSTVVEVARALTAHHVSVVLEDGHLTCHEGNTATILRQAPLGYWTAVAVPGPDRLLVGSAMYGRWTR